MNKYTMSNDLVLTHPVIKSLLIVEACVAERVRPRTLDLEAVLAFGSCTP